VELIHIEIHGTEKGKGDVKSMQLATTDMGSIKAREWLPVSRKEDGSLEPLRKAKKWAKAGLRDLPPRLRETLEVEERWRLRSAGRRRRGSWTRALGCWCR